MLAACGGERKQLKAQVGLLDTVGWARLSSFPLFLQKVGKRRRRKVPNLMEEKEEEVLWGSN